MKNSFWSQTCVYSSFAVLLVLGQTHIVIAEPAQKKAETMTRQTPPEGHFFNFNVTSVDAINEGLKVSHEDVDIQSFVGFDEIIVTKATQFKREESGLHMSDLRVGDVLLEVENNDVGSKHERSHYTADGLEVTSLHPLTLNIRRPRSWGSPLGPVKPKPGQTLERATAMAQTLQGLIHPTEIEGIGVFQPRHEFPFPQTLVVQESSNLTFTRCNSVKPPSMTNFSVGQLISFEGTRRPDDKFTANTIWLIDEHSQDALAH